MLKNIYIQKAKNLSKEYQKYKDYLKKISDKIEEDKNTIENYRVNIDEISNDDNLDPNHKYIKIQEYLDDIETISERIEENMNNIKEEYNRIYHQRKILIENCREEHHNLTEDEIIEKINYYFQ